MTDIDAIFAADRQHPPHERSLPWLETRGGLTVVVEPKPHWASDMRAFRSEAQFRRDLMIHQGWPLLWLMSS